MKKIEDYTLDELSAKIEAIKSERERTENALKKYEEELERRKQEVPLGVPLINASQYETFYWLNGAGIPCKEIADSSCDVQLRQCSFLNVFHSKESAEKHAEMLLAWRKALVANSKDEPIDIKALSPLMRRGKVAFCPIVYSWFWTNKKPICSGDTWKILGEYEWLKEFNLKPADDWKTSLMECGL